MYFKTIRSLDIKILGILKTERKKAVVTIFTCYRLFQKVDTWMNKEDQVDTEAKKRLDDATQVTCLIFFMSSQGQYTKPKSQSSPTNETSHP